MDKINQGDEELIKKEDWVPEEDISGDLEKILVSQIMNKAQERILDIYKPKNNIAFISLCTATRPYSTGRKWAYFMNEFDNVDFIVSSGSGIIVPIEYDTSYPFMTYDATHNQKEYDSLYNIFLMQKLVRFFTLKRYEYILFNYRPTLPELKVMIKVGNYLKARGHIKDYVIAPDDRTYKLAQLDGFADLGLSMYPDLHPIVIRDLHKKIDIFRSIK
jgi:hypothetical protein